MLFSTFFVCRQWEQFQQRTSTLWFLFQLHIFFCGFQQLVPVRFVFCFFLHFFPSILQSMKSQSSMRSSSTPYFTPQQLAMGMMQDGNVLQAHVPFGNGTSGGGSGGGGGVNTILRVVVDNAMYPVTLDVLHGVCPLWWCLVTGSGKHWLKL